MSKLQYQPLEKKKAEITIKDDSTSVKIPKDTKHYGIRAPSQSTPSNDVVFRMSSYPFQYWRTANVWDEDCLKDEEIIQSHILDYSDFNNPSAQRLAHLERTQERAKFYKKLQEYEEAIESERNRRSGLPDEQILRDKYTHLKEMQSEGTMDKPTPPLSKYAQ